MPDTQKCAHEACVCIVKKNGEFGKFCSEHCRETAKMTSLRCGCQHPDCR